MAAFIRSLRKQLPSLTFTGYNYILITVVAGLWGFQARSRPGMLTAAVLAAGLIAAWLGSFYALKNLQIKRIIQGSFTAGELFVIQYEVENRKLFFPVFHLLITDYCANTVFDGSYYNFLAETGLVPPGGKAFANYSGRIKERGVLDFDIVRLSTRFPFGLFLCHRDFNLPDRIRSFPAVPNIRKQGFFTREVTGYADTRLRRWERGYDEFRGTREYRIGDNPRWINWKASARHPHELRIREYNTAEERDVFVIFDPVTIMKTRRNRNIKFEIAIRYTLSLIRHLLSQGNQVTFYTFDEQFTEIERIRSSRDYNRVLAVMAGIKEVRGADFFASVEKRARAVKRIGAGVIIIGAGIRGMYQELFSGYNAHVIDIQEERIKSVFTGDPLAV